MIPKMFVFIVCPHAQSMTLLIMFRCGMLLTELNVKHWPFGKLNALCLLGGEM